MKQVRELQIGGDSSNIPGKNYHSPMPTFIKQVRELLIRGKSSSIPCKRITHLHRIRATVIIQFEVLSEHRNVQYGVSVPALGPGANTCQFGGPRLFFLAKAASDSNL
jgi:hypothetical protein